MRYQTYWRKASGYLELIHPLSLYPDSAYDIRVTGACGQRNYYLIAPPEYVSILEGRPNHDDRVLFRCMHCGYLQPCADSVAELCMTRERLDRGQIWRLQEVKWN
jgi:hypothetical protein